MILSHNAGVTCVRNVRKKWSVTVFVSEIERVEKYPDFEILAQETQHGLLGF